MHEIRRGSAGRIGKSILEFTQMLRVIRADSSNAYISVSILARQGPFSQVWSQLFRNTTVLGENYGSVYLVVPRVVNFFLFL